MKTLIKDIEKKLKQQEMLTYGGFTLLFILMVLIGGLRPNVGNLYNPTIFGGITWYALFIMTGVAFAFVLGLIEFKRFGKDPDILYTGILIFLPLAIVGARVWFVIFNPGTPLIPQGMRLAGLAIHGGVIVTFVGTIFFCKWKKINYWWFLDVVVPGFFLGQIFGRWGNFFNAELYGPVIQSQWVINILPGFIRNQMTTSLGVHHPTFLYESLLNLVGVIFLLIIRRKKLLKVGDMLAFYLVWYGLVRIPIEVLRINSGVGEALGFGGIEIRSMAQWYLSVSLWTSFALITAGLAVFFGKRKLQPNLPYYVQGKNKAILFDLDGTLLDTQPLINQTFIQVFKDKFPQHQLTTQELNSFFGPTLNQTFSKYTDDPQKIQELIDYYRQINREIHNQGVKTFPNVVQTLQALKDKGYLLGVVSSKSEEFVRMGLRQNELEEYFTAIVCYEDVTEHKPAPQGIQLAMTQLGSSPENTVYVGDHPNDIKAAQAAGVVSVGVYYANFVDEILQLKPDYMVDTLDKLLEII